MNLIIGFVSTSVSIAAGIVVGFFAFHTEEAITPLAEETVAAVSITQEPIQETSPHPESSPDVLAVVTPNASPTPTPVVSPTPSATLAPTPQATPMASATLQPTPVASPAATPKPSPTPAPSVARATSAEMDGWFNEYAGSSSVSIELLRKIAVCESGYNQFARNGIYGGLYQFSSSTWESTRKAMNADPNPDLRFDAKEAIRTAAFRIATMGSAAWPNCD